MTLHTFFQRSMDPIPTIARFQNPSKQVEELLHLQWTWTSSMDLLSRILYVAHIKLYEIINLACSEHNNQSNYLPGLVTSSTVCHGSQLEQWTFHSNRYRCTQQGSCFVRVQKLTLLCCFLIRHRRRRSRYVHRPWRCTYFFPLNLCLLYWNNLIDCLAEIMCPSRCTSNYNRLLGALGGAGGRHMCQSLFHDLFAFNSFDSQTCQVSSAATFL